MAISEALLPEFDQEMAGVRKTLERVPADKRRRVWTSCSRYLTRTWRRPGLRLRAPPTRPWCHRGRCSTMGSPRSACRASQWYAHHRAQLGVHLRL